MSSRARRSSAVIRDRIGDTVPRVAIVLGSGLGDLADRVEQSVAVPYAHVPDMPESTVKGHGGEFVSGHLEGVPVILQRGRVHLYEGLTPSSVGTAIRAFAELGVEALIVTNAAGGINRGMEPPSLMLISDHINMMFRSPLAGPVWPEEERFPDMAAPYDPELRELARRVALERGIRLHEGVYVGVLGPSYETPAEIRMLERLGADAVGMSTVPEVIVARARGLRVLGISTITNQAAGLGQHSLSHDEVLEAGKAVGRDLEVLVRGVLREL